jgi:hypothetical protein
MGSGKKSLMVDVTNEGAIPVDIRLAFVYDTESRRRAARKPRKGQMQDPHEHMKGGVEFRASKRGPSGPLQPGEKRRYLYPPQAIPQLRSLVQSLPPDRYHLGIKVNGKRSVAVAGEAFGAFVENRLPEEA